MELKQVLHGSGEEQKAQKWPKKESNIFFYEAWQKNIAHESVVHLSK